MLDFTNGGLNWDSLEKNLGKDITSDKKNYKDERFWSLSRDENDNGAAIIRLLPDPEGEPFIKLYTHAFQSFDAVSKKKRWYINNSPSTIEMPCPASELWSAVIGEGSEEGKMEAKNFSRKIQFITNIKVIKDPANPQNEGKIFLWKFGTKLKDKFMAALNPSETDRSMGEEPKQLFNPLSGNNIKIKIKKAAGFLNYDDTTIENETSIYANGEEAKKDILENAHKLSDFKKEDSFETYEELKKKLIYVVECYSPKNLDPDKFKKVIAPVIDSTNKTEQSDNSTTVNEPVKETPVETTSKPVNEPVKETPVETTTETSSDDLDFLDDL